MEKCFFQSYDECFIIFFGFGQILIDLAHTFAKKALFLRFLWSLLITYLITSSVDKENIVLEKSIEKVLNFESTTPSTLLYHILIVYMKFHKLTM